VIPTAIVAGFVLGVWTRWWAVPIVALGWALVIAFYVDPSSALAAAVLGAVNGAVGAVVAVGLRRVLDGFLPPRPDQPSGPN
jgi:hypothetical protein